jgi:hypothetical protein
MIPDSRLVNIICDPRDIPVFAQTHSRRITAMSRNDPERVSDKFLMNTPRYWQPQLHLVETVRTQRASRSFDIP